MKRFTALFAAAIAAVSAASAQMPGQGQQPSYGMPQQNLTQPMGGYAQRSFTPPSQVNLQSLSGQWFMGNDAEPLQAQVDPSGRFIARGRIVTLQGQFRGMAGQGTSKTTSRNGRPIQDRAQFQFDGQCHIAVVVINRQNRPIFQSNIHVNHRAGQPCPR